MKRDYEQERRDYDKRCEAIALAAKSLKQDEIDRTCARYELEPDEFQTAEDKARAILRPEPARRPAKTKLENTHATQRKLLTGLDCLPGQTDLFETDGT